MSTSTEPLPVADVDVAVEDSPATSNKETLFSNWPPPLPTHPPGHAAPTHPTSKPPGAIYPTTTQGSVTQDVDTTCGTKNGKQDQERIVGGHNADPNEWPWIAVLFNGPRQFCGGSLIDSEHILTAAHCVAQ